MKMCIVSQWRWPIQDFQILSLGASYFDPADFYWHWNIQLVIVGIILVVGKRGVLWGGPPPTSQTVYVPST